jgi:hypothetical protein
VWRNGRVAPEFLIFALDEGEWSFPRHCRFARGENTPGTHWIGGYVGPKSRSGRHGEDKISCPYLESNSDPSLVQLVA